VTNATGFRTIESGESPVVTTDGYKVTTIVVTEAAFAADFKVSPDPLPAGYDLQFTDKSTGTPTAWLWNFGDGTTSTLQNPTHKYAAAGNYVVSLAATANGVTKTVTATFP
jgi:large repetitive protein